VVRQEAGRAVETEAANVALTTQLQLTSEARKIENGVKVEMESQLQKLSQQLAQKALENDRVEREADLCRKAKDAYKEERNQALQANAALIGDFEKLELEKDRQATQHAFDHMSRATWEFDMATQQKEEMHVLRAENENAKKQWKAEQMNLSKMMQEEMQFLRQENERTRLQWKAEQSIWRAEFKEMEQELASKVADERRQNELLQKRGMQSQAQALEAEQSLWRAEFKEMAQELAVKVADERRQNELLQKRSIQSQERALEDELHTLRTEGEQAKARWKAEHVALKAEVRESLQESLERSSRLEHRLQMALDKQDMVWHAKQDGLPSAVQDQLKNILEPVSCQIKDIERRFVANASEVSDARAAAETMRCRFEAELTSFKKTEAELEQHQFKMQKTLGRESKRDIESLRSQLTQLQKVGTDDIMKTVITMQKSFEDAIATKYAKSASASQSEYQQLVCELQEAKASARKASELLQAKDVEHQRQELFAKSKLEHIHERQLYEKQESEWMKERYRLECQALKQEYRQTQIAWDADPEGSPQEAPMPRSSRSLSRYSDTYQSHSKLRNSLADAIQTAKQLSSSDPPTARRHPSKTNGVWSNRNM